MNEAMRAALAPTLVARRAELVLDWQHGLQRTSFVAYDPREANRRLTELTNQAIDALLAEPFDPQGGKTIGAAFANLHILQPEALGVSQELLLRHLAVDLPPEQAAALLPRLGPLLGAFAGGFFQQSLAIILNQQEEIRGALLAQRQRAEAALERQYREAERARGETRAVLDAAAEAIALVAPDGRFLTINRRFGELLGLQSEEVAGRRLDELRAVVERVFAEPAAIWPRLTDTADQEQQFTDIVQQRWPQRRELELFSTPVQSESGEPLGRLFAFRDVTREREVSRMKSDFVALVSHELRTPLTSIKGYIDLLLAEDAGALNTEQCDFLTIVKNNADRLVTLINDLLDLSRIESGRIEARRERLDIATLIAGVAAAFRPQLERKGQHLALDFDAGLPAVSGDADRIIQVFTNLISNAHKYTPNGGSITVRGTAEREAVRVDVTDSGMGLTPDEQGQLFTRFFRSRRRAAQEAGGTGLGLVITRSLVEMHGGVMSVTSQPGQGATFSVTLPSYQQRKAPPMPAPRRAVAAGTPYGGRVLVVDDEPDIAQLLQRFLERAGYQVLVAHRAAEALQLARADQPDLITLDLAMPDDDGFTILEWLKSDPATAAIPVMLISILEDSGRGKRLGAVDYLTKPVQEQTLRAHVAAALTKGGSRLILARLLGKSFSPEEFAVTIARELDRDRA